MAHDSSSSTTKYRVQCSNCSHGMRVKRRHFGRMCRCTQCDYPIYVTYNNVEPPVPASERRATRFYTADAVPLIWKKGDRLMELYEVRELLGEGGMGTVHKVNHRGWGHDLAVKSPKYAKHKDDGWLELFEHECETWINLPPFPHMVTCHYVRRLGGIPRVFVEYVPGDDLGSLCKRKVLYQHGKAAAQQRILDVLIQFAWGLNHAHERGVLHQDVKPSNVLIAPENFTKVTDFGLARLLHPDALGDLPRDKRFAREGLSGGTPVYLAPDGENGYAKTIQSDIWSWALSVVQVYAGKVFWHEGKEGEKALDMLLERGGYFAEIPAMPADLQALLWRCLAIDPEKRPASLLEIAGELESIYATVTASPYPRKRPEYREAHAGERNNRAISLVDLGRQKEALALWDTVIKGDEEHVQALFNKHLHLWRTGGINEGEIVKSLYSLCETRPNDWLPRLLLARILMEQGSFRPATEILDKLQRLRPGDREIAHARAVAKEKAKRDRRMAWENKVHSSALSAIALSGDGTLLASGCEEGKVRLWTAARGEKAATLEGHTDVVTCTAFSSNGVLLASGSLDQSVRVWNFREKRCLLELTGHARCVNGVVFVNKDAQLLTICADGALRVWDVASGALVDTLRGHLDAILCVAVSDNHRYVLTGGRDSSIKLWDMESRKVVQSYSGNGGPVSALTVSQRRPTVVSAHKRTIKIWDMKSGKIVRELHGHNSHVEKLQLFDPSPMLLSASKSTVRLWNIFTGQCIHSFPAGAPIVAAPNGEQFYGGGGKGAMRCFDVFLSEEPVLAPYVLSSFHEPRRAEKLVELSPAD